MIRVMIVDDHLLFADAIRTALEDAGMTVVAECSASGEALEAAERLRPDLILLDIRLPLVNGLELGKQLLATFPSIRLLAVSALDDKRVAREALKVGFHGYVTKYTPVRKFIRSVKAVLEGQVVINRGSARRSAGHRDEEEELAALLAEQLTARERQVLALLTEGESGEGIAKRLSVSSHTVRTHVQSILTKLQVHSRLEAAAFAIRYGVVPGRRGGSGVA